MSTPDRGAYTKSGRVLACVLCQQRKVKCDRRFPCANCIKTSAQCVQASLASRQRRRRFPERELLERLRRYEGLLRENQINFEPLHTPAADKVSPNGKGRDAGSVDDPVLEGKTPATSETTHETPRSVWHAMNQSSRDNEDDYSETDDSDDNDRYPHVNLRESAVKKAWNQAYGTDDHLLFGPRQTELDLSAMHPGQLQIFRLWQVYLDNVNSLLKVTHTPSLQVRILDAASDVTKISAPLAALMFSIYCVSILSLVDDDCRALFGSTRKELLTSYQFGCQQALLRCGFLRSSDRDCLTAFYLYLLSVRPTTDPQSLSSMLGVALRIAQRMGIHDESTYGKHTALEAEMRRRLWWSLIIFDNRIAEMSEYKTSMLVPTWYCRTPINVNDFDIRPEMTTMPSAHEEPTEALFAVVRSEVGDFVRHSSFHLDFTNPSLKKLATDTQHGSVPVGGELAALEKHLNDRYLKFCNEENPLHLMTMWTTQGYLAKAHLIEHYARSWRSSVPSTDIQRNDAFLHALTVLRSDTKVMTSPLTKGYVWFVHLYFPFPAYIHIVQDLKKRPSGEHAEKAWGTMSDNYLAHSMHKEQDDSPFIKIFSKIVLQAWEACEAIFGQLDEPLELPRIVSDIKQKTAQATQLEQDASATQSNDVFAMGTEFAMSMPGNPGSQDPLAGIGWQGYFGSEAMTYPYSNMTTQPVLGSQINDMNCSPMEWNPFYGNNWSRW